jgi:hypothetical protein
VLGNIPRIMLALNLCSSTFIYVSIYPNYINFANFSQSLLAVFRRDGRNSVNFLGLFTYWILMELL